MARDPFAEFDGPAVASPVAPSRGSTPVVMRVVSAVSVLALLGLLFGYYLPLRTAHTMLSDKYQGKSSELGGTSDQLKKTSDLLLAAQSERDQLKGDAEKQKSSQEGRDGAVQKNTSTLEQALSRFIKSKQLVVETRGPNSVVVIDDKQVFGKRDASPPAKGKKFLCEVAKAIKALPGKNDVVVSGHTASNKVTDPILKRDFPSVWQLSAMRAGGAVSALQGCGVSGDAVRAVGLADTDPDEKSAKGSTGELRLSIQPRG